MPHLWSTAMTALQGNAPAIDSSTCFFAVEIFISPSTLPSVLRPWFGRSSQVAVRGSVGGEASSPARPRFGLRVRVTHCSAAAL
jgi:hypothetical protein